MTDSMQIVCAQLEETAPTTDEELVFEWLPLAARAILLGKHRFLEKSQYFLDHFDLSPEKLGRLVLKRVRETAYDLQNALDEFLGLAITDAQDMRFLRYLDMTKKRGWLDERGFDAIRGLEVMTREVALDPGAVEVLEEYRKTLDGVSDSLLLPSVACPLTRDEMFLLRAMVREFANHIRTTR